jgi:hypothetical protein
MNHVKINTSKIYRRLALYHAVNSIYHDIEIVQDVNFDAIHTLPSHFNNAANINIPVPENVGNLSAMLINDPIHSMIHRIQDTTDVAQVRSNEDIGQGLSNDENEDIDMTADDMIQVDTNIPPLIAQAASLLISGDGSDRYNVGNQIAEQSINGINEFFQNLQPPVQHIPGIKTVPIPAPKRVPLNEYIEMKRIMLESFNEEFLLGKGVPTNSPMSLEYVQHLLRQYTNKFSDNKEFMFYAFNVMQRAATSRAVARRCINSPTATKNVTDYIHDSSFLADLEFAVKNPQSDTAKTIIRKLSPMLHNLGNASVSLVLGLGFT